MKIIIIILSICGEPALTIQYPEDISHIPESKQEIQILHIELDKLIGETCI